LIHFSLIERVISVITLYEISKVLCLFVGTVVNTKRLGKYKKSVTVDQVLWILYVP